ncbi:YicC/YloC family endoribonuclease [Tepidibacillus infernus]|uniref:YicC/YloC family endoribonuclease n=1 Tax=Tepidibacillus infernus TaxID=1806172 RepID=UPI003A2E70DA
MIKSMTGYGRAESSFQGLKWSVEIRSVNHRYNEIMFKMPKEWMAIEEQMKKIIQTNVKRGKVDVFIVVGRDDQSKQPIKVDWELLDEYIKVIQEIKKRLNLEGQLVLKDLLTVPELIQFELEFPDIDLFVPEILKTVELACQSLMTMRLREGNALYEELTSRVHKMMDLLIQIENRAPQVIEDYRQKLKTRISDWLNDTVELDEARFLNEIAFFTDKANIDEEITRLRSHFQQFLLIMEQDEPIGRKLDFLIQEMNREMNTIGSKANDLLLSQIVVELKSELEKIREQVQNIE